MPGWGAEPLVFLWGALLLLTVPLPWLLAAGLAMAVHEACHYAAIRLLGGQARGFRLGPRGALMETSALTPGRELLCALAGPGGSMALGLLLPVLPRTALCGILQGCYNLLPLFPLDGGRILRCLGTLTGWERAAAWVERCLLLLLCLLALAAALWLRLGLLPILGVAALFLGKIPCKPGPLGVQ